MYKDGVVTIADWYTGQAESPYQGFDSMRNVDVFSTPGVARISYLPTLNFPTVGVPVAHVVDKYGNVWDLIRNTGSGNAVLFKNAIPTTFPSFSSLVGVGWDMVEYKNQLVIRTGSILNILALDGSTVGIFQNWTPTGFVALDANFYGKMLVSKNDGLLYIANGANIKRISAFVPSVNSITPPTALMDTAVVLPSELYATTIGELGDRLMVGTQTGSSWETRYNSQRAVILPYRIGVSAVNFDNPVIITNANCVQQIMVSNGVMYITAGMKGNVYLSDGTSYRKIRRIPYFVKDEYGMGILYYPNAITIGNNGNLLIGTTSFSNGYYGTGAQHGMYEMNLSDSKYPIVLKNTISTGSFEGTQTIGIGFVFQSVNDALSIGWQDGNTYGVDVINGYKYGNYKAVIESQVHVVGSKLKKASFQQAEVTFGQPLTTGQGVKLWYRKNTVDSYVLIGEWTYASELVATTNAVDINKKALIADATLLQIKIELTTPPTGSGADAFNNVELLTVKIW